MKIVIADDYQDIADKLPCFALIRHHEVTRYTDSVRDLDTLVERLVDADVIVAIRERVRFSRPLLERLPRLKLIALLGRTAGTIDFAACTELGIPVATGVSNSPESPAEHTVALIAFTARRLVFSAWAPLVNWWPKAVRAWAWKSWFGVGRLRSPRLAPLASPLRRARLNSSCARMWFRFMCVSARTHAASSGPKIWRG